MSWSLRIPAPLLEAVRADLARAHPFAAERIGFVICRGKVEPDGSTLLLACDYLRVPDEEYLRDTTVGARIGSAAIRRGMRAVLADDTACLHVHAHPGKGAPAFSRVDLREIPPLVQAFANVRPELPHGALLLSEDSVSAAVWRQGARSPESGGKIVVVGRPMQFAKGVVDETG